MDEDMREVTLVGGPLDGRTMRVGPGVFRIDTPGTFDSGYAYRPREKNATEWHYEHVGSPYRHAD